MKARRKGLVSNVKKLFSLYLFTGFKWFTNKIILKAINNLLNFIQIFLHTDRELCNIKFQYKNFCIKILLTWNIKLALSLRVVSSGESTGICFVKRVSNCDTSSSLRYIYYIYTLSIYIYIYTNKL